MGDRLGKRDIQRLLKGGVGWFLPAQERVRDLLRDPTLEPSCEQYQYIIFSL